MLWACVASPAAAILSQMLRHRSCCHSALHRPCAAFRKRSPARSVAQPAAGQQQDSFGSQHNQERLEEERLRLRSSGALGLRAKLRAVGVDCDGINNEGTLVDLLAEAHVQARSQVVKFKLKHSSRRARRRSHLVVPVDIEGVGFTSFLIDTGTSSTMITSRLRAELGLSPMEGNFMTGVDSSGLTVRQKVRLPPLTLGSRELHLDSAIVTKDLSESIGGVLGLSFLRQVEVDVNSAEGTVAFHPVGHVEQGILEVSGMQRISLVNGKGGLVLAAVSLNNSATIPAILDLSATSSSLNGAAAQLAGVNVYGILDDGSMYVDASDLLIKLLHSELLADADSAAGADSSAEATGGHGTSLPEGEVLACRSSEPVVVREVPNLDPLGFKDVPFMILGTDVLCKQRTVLAFGSNAIYLGPS